MRTSWLPSDTQAQWLRVGVGQSGGPQGGLERDAADSSIYRLVPMVFARAAAELDGPSLAFAKQVFRTSWAQTQRRLHQSALTLDGLHGLGIETCLLKGAGLVGPAYSGQTAQRPLSDIDVLFRPDQVEAAVVYLRSIGYSTPSKAEFGPGTRAAYAGANFFRGAYDGIDVHWKINHWQGDRDLQTRMWGRRVPARVGTTNTTTLSRTDHLIHTFMHGCADNELHPCRWVADAALLIDGATSDDPVDWEQFVNECTRSRIVIGARIALRWLVEELHVEMPTTVLERLDSEDVGPIDRLTAWVRGQPATRRTMAARLLVVDFAHRTTGLPVPRRIAAYPAYLRDTIRRDDAPVLRSALRIVRIGLGAKP